MPDPNKRYKITFTNCFGEQLHGTVIEFQDHLARVSWQDWTHTTHNRHGQRETVVTPAHVSWVNWTLESYTLQELSTIFDLALATAPTASQETVVWAGGKSKVVLRPDGQELALILVKGQQENKARFAVRGESGWQVTMTQGDYEAWSKAA